MDVRCEKCQTEYELDEARLKPGGVTVKCTNCGHMFKIRKRSNTAAGTPVVSAPEAARAKSPSAKPAGSVPAQPQQTAAGAGYTGPGRSGDLSLDEAPTEAAERQWLIRLENGEQKSCKELAALQQWIVGHVVTREALISRTGKTWKRLGDIPELTQYFDVADEARTTARKASPSKPPAQGTLLGVAGPAGGATAAGGTILPDDDAPTARKVTHPPPVPKTPPVGVPAQAQAPRRPATQPPPPPKKGSGHGDKGSGYGPDEGSGPGPDRSSQSGPLPVEHKASSPPPAGNRATALWANDEIKPAASSGNSGPTSGPFRGKLAAIPDEPAFAGRVRTTPSGESSFDTDRVRMPHGDAEEDGVLPSRRGSSAGMWILLVVLLLGGATTVALYFLVFRKDDAAKPPADAQAIVQQTSDAAPVVTPVPDGPDNAVSPVEAARHELGADNETRLQAQYDSFAGKDEPESLALRAQFGAAIAQGLNDRAGLIEKSDADKLRKQSKTLVLEAVTSANKAQKALPDDPSANLAYAHVLRLQGKPARDVKRYLEAAKSKTKQGEWMRDVLLAEGLLAARDGKLDDAKAAFAKADSGEDKLEVSNDVRARFHLALVALAQGKSADAKPLVDQVLAAQPDHLGAKALSAKLETLVAKTDPLPPEDPKPGSGSNVVVGPGSGSGSATKPPDPGESGGSDYDSLLKKANTLAETNCTKANDVYAKALVQKPNGVEALTGQGYCALDAKNFSTAHRKFTTALAASSRYEPALAGIAETYSSQGRRDDAIAAWRRYLDAFPGSAKGTKALERLGAGAATPTPGSNAGSGSDAPPPPTPTPTPTPAPDGAGSGSG